MTWENTHVDKNVVCVPHSARKSVCESAGVCQFHFGKATTMWDATRAAWWKKKKAFLKKNDDL